MERTCFLNRLRVSEPGRGKQEILKKMKKVLDESKMVRYND